MIEKLAQAGDERGSARPPPFHYIYHVQSCSFRSNWEGRSSCFISTLLYTDKKENKIFLIYKEYQKGAVAKSYMTNGLLIYG